MKTIQYILFLSALLFTLNSCELDNYDAPDASFNGIIIDKTTGEGISTEQPNGIRIKWTELSWGSNVQPDYFSVMPDGTFNWNQVFGYDGSSYEIVPVEGAFVEPEPQVVSIKKGEHKELRFEVIPYIHIDSEYEVNGRELTVRFTATRPEGSVIEGESPYTINQVWILVSNKTKYVSLINQGGYVSGISKRITPFNESRLGQEITTTLTFEPGVYYFRVAIRTANPSGASNFTKVERIEIQ